MTIESLGLGVGAYNDNGLYQSKPVTEEIAKENANSASSLDATPAAELILSDQVRSSIRNLSISAQNKNVSLDDYTGAGRASAIMKRCTALATRASNDNLSAGERTYIQSEIDFLKHNLSILDIAI